MEKDDSEESEGTIRLRLLNQSKSKLIMGWLELQKRRYPVDIYRFASAIGGECHFKLQAISTSCQLSVKCIKQSSYLPSNTCI